MLLLIDNYDSFTWNLAQYLGEIGAEVKVVRNDAMTIDQIRDLHPERIVISPGPCTPNKAGRSKEIIEQFSPTIPTLGVCLGHQCIGEVYGGVVEQAQELMHGKTSMIRHDDSPIYAGLDNPFEATRYHSLIVRKQDLPQCLVENAWTEDGTIMGMHHKQFPLWGVQFHPESILTASGKKLLTNFMNLHKGTSNNCFSSRERKIL